MRLEQGRRPSFRRPARASRASAPGARWAPAAAAASARREDYVRTRRRGGANDAAAGGGRRVEGSRRASSPSRTASSRTPPRSARRPTARSRPPRPSSRRPIPKSIKLKDPKDWKIAGKPMKRLDTATKLNGSLVYAIDVKLPGMLLRGDQGLPGVRRQARELRRSEDRRPARRRRAPSRSTTRPSRSSPTRGGARRPRSTRLPIVWDEGPNATRNRARRSPTHLKEGLTAPRRLRDAPGRRRAEGDRRRREEGRGRLPHAVPRARDDGADELHGADHAGRAPKSGSPTQNGEASLAALSEASGLPLEKCEVYKHMLGGGFGRRGGAQDYVRQAVAIAQAVSRRARSR